MLGGKKSTPKKRKVAGSISEHLLASGLTGGNFLETILPFLPLLALGKNAPKPKPAPKQAPKPKPKTKKPAAKKTTQKKRKVMRGGMNAELLIE